MSIRPWGNRRYRYNPDIPSIDVFQMLGLLASLPHSNTQFKENKGVRFYKKYWQVQAENHDMITVSFHDNLTHLFEEVAVDLINENGWHISGRDNYDGMTHVNLSPDQGMVLAPPAPLVMYHLTLASNLNTIRVNGLTLGTGIEKHHEISYTPRIFLTSNPNSLYGIAFPKNQLLAIIAVKTWMLPSDTFYQRDPQFADRSYESCFIDEPIPAAALVLPRNFPRAEVFIFDEHDISVNEFIPEVIIPKRIQLKRIYELGKMSPTPLRTTGFNFAGSVLERTPYYQSKFWKSDIGQKFDTWFVENTAKYTPPGHPWNDGPIFRA